MLAVAALAAMASCGNRAEAPASIVDSGELAEMITAKISEISSDSIGSQVVVNLNNPVDSQENDQTLEILAIVLGLGMPSVVVVGIIYMMCLFSYRKRRDHNQIISLALQRGVELPKEFYMGECRQPKSRLNSALTWLAIGIGTLIFSIGCSDHWFGFGLSAILILLGIAKLIVWFVERPHRSKEEADQCSEN